MEQTSLSTEAKAVLEALCQHAEGSSRGEWRDVYLDNARPAGMSDKTFRAYLAVLSKAGFYRVIDGYAWGEVRDTAFQVVSR